MALLSELILRLKAETADFQQGMRTASNEAERAFKQIEGAAGKLGVSLSAGAFLLMTKGAIDAADHLNDLSKTTRISVEELAGLGILAKQSGGDVEGMAQSINKLSMNMGKTPEKFKALGISTKDPLEAFKQFADLTNLVDDQSLRAAASAAALGKSWASAAPAMAEGGKKIGDIVSRGRELTGMTKEIAEQADEFNDKLVLLVHSGRLWNDVIDQMLPMLNMLADEALEGQKSFGVLNAAMFVAAETLRTIVIMGSDVKYAFQTIGIALSHFSYNLANGFSTTTIEATKKMDEEFDKFYAKRRQQLDEFQQRIMNAGRASESSVSMPKAVKDPAAVKDAEDRMRKFAESGDKTLALEKRMASAVQEMENKRKALFGTTEEALMQERIYGMTVTMTDGSVRKIIGTYAEFDATVKKWLITRAREIDLQKRRVEVGQAVHAALEAEAAAQAQSDAVIKDRLFADHATIDNMNHQIALVGKSAREQEVLNAQREVELNLRRDLAALPKLDDSASDAQIRMNADAQAMLRARAQEATDAIVGGIKTRQEAERNWVTGATLALKNYSDAATNAAANVDTAFTGAFNRLEDQLATGKTNLHAFVEASILDLRRLLVRQFITGPLASALGNVLGFGGAGGGIQALDASALKGSVSLNAMGLAVDTVSVSVSTLDVVTTDASGSLIAFSAALETATAAAMENAGGSTAGNVGGILGLLGLGGGGGAAAAGGGEILDAGITALAFAANGGVMTSRGMMNLNRYSSGGVADGPQLAMFGEGRMREAYVPLPDGRSIPVTLDGDMGDGVHFEQHIHFSANTPAAVRDAVRAAVPEIAAITKRHVFDSMRRGQG